MDFSFNKYFVFMVLIIALIPLGGTIAASLIAPYDVETSEEFDNYLNAFSDDTYKDNLQVDASKESDGTFAEYESSFKFGEQAKQTQNQTKVFIQSTTTVLGLDASIWYIIFTIVSILILLGILAYLRGVGKI